jgi:hypothetical protein
MNIIFVGPTGVHHALIAAHIFMGDLHNNDYRQVKHFDDHKRDLSGELIYVGQDKEGAQVYTFGAGRNHELAAVIISDFRSLFGIGPEELVAWAVTVPGYLLFYALGYIPPCLGGRYLTNLLAGWLSVRQFEHIRTETLAFKDELKRVRR